MSTIKCKECQHSISLESKLSKCSQCGTSIYRLKKQYKKNHRLAQARILQAEITSREKIAAINCDLEAFGEKTKFNINQQLNTIKNQVDESVFKDYAQSHLDEANSVMKIKREESKQAIELIAEDLNNEILIINQQLSLNDDELAPQPLIKKDLNASKVDEASNESKVLLFILYAIFFGCILAAAGAVSNQDTTGALLFVIGGFTLMPAVSKWLLQKIDWLTQFSASILPHFIILAALLKVFITDIT